jgi:pumilio family protein 6
MARAMKASGGGAATKRRDRRQAKFRPGPGPDSVKPIGVADAPEPAAAPKAKKSLGKLSKKRKAEGGLGGGGGDAGAVEKKKKFVKNETSDEKPSKGTKKPLPTKKEQKEWSNEQKALTKPNHTLIAEMVGHWERLRSKKSAAGKKMSADERRALVDAVFRASKGKVPELANNHKGSRVIQALLKHGTEAQKRSVYEECTPAVAALAKSLYGHFLVKKLVDETPKKDLPALLAHVKGKVRALAKHPVGSQVLESLYFPAPPAQKLAMRCEFYGSEFAFFGAAGADANAKGGDAPKNLRDAMRLKPAAQRQGMLRQMNAALLPILEKGLVSPSLVHAALAEYLEVGGPGTKHEAAQSLAGPAYLRMIHTREGANAANVMFAHAGAKQRKAVLKALKGQVGRIARDEHASTFVACALECTDDTKLTAKAIVAELRDEGIADLADDRAARRVLLHALRPRSTRYVHPHVLATMPDPRRPRGPRRRRATRSPRGGTSRTSGGGEEDVEEDVEGDDADDEEMDDEMDDEMMDDEFLEDDEDEDEDALEEKPAKVNVMSKQRSRAAEAGGDDMDDDDDDDGRRRRREHGFRRVSQKPGGAPPRDFRRARALGSVARGGVREQRGKHASLGDGFRRPLRDVLRRRRRRRRGRRGRSADARAARRRRGGGARLSRGRGARRGRRGRRRFRERGSSSARGLLLDARAPAYGARDSRGRGRDGTGDAKHRAPPFAAALWEGAVSRDVRAWIGGHGAKVVAAIVKAGDAATVKACVAALAKALPKGQSPTSWAEGFFRQRSDEKADGKAKAAQTPAGKKKVSKKADENAATPAAATRESVSKSPKDKKFSPRLTRAQRLAKAAKGKK